MTRESMMQPTDGGLQGANDDKIEPLSPITGHHLAGLERRRHAQKIGISGLSALFALSLLYIYQTLLNGTSFCGFGTSPHAISPPYGQFPRPADPFRFQPCTNLTRPPALEDPHPEKSWASIFDPNPDNWSWGNTALHYETVALKDPYLGRGIYLCGYLDVPLDYTNASETRLVRLGITKFQVSGLQRVDGASPPNAGLKSARTIVINPGGPGGSGTSNLWQTAENKTEDLSKTTMDVLGWDPRGVNTSLPRIQCSPHAAYRDRWSLLAAECREESGSPTALLEAVDVLNNAMLHSCWEKLGDLPRFMTTASVARDLEQIRLALGEEELTGHLVSYGTGIGQTYVNMFPSSAGRVILDGTEYVRDHRLLGGFGWTALDNTTDAWRDGFLGECIKAGPEHCALAETSDSENLTVTILNDRMKSMLGNLAKRPLPGYTDWTGPSIVTYSGLIEIIYSSLYNAESWPALAKMLFDLEKGNTTLASEFLESHKWDYDPNPDHSSPPDSGSSWDLGIAVICGDSYDASMPESGLMWWDALWANMTRDSWVAGDSRFHDVLPCRHYTTYWPQPAEVYRGDLNHTLKNPVLLVAEVYDPATPLRNGRRLLHEMGENARLVVHHGYGHSARDKSKCTNSIKQRYIMDGAIPTTRETECYADEKPYMYGHGAKGKLDPVKAWSEHTRAITELRRRK